MVKYFRMKFSHLHVHSHYSLLDGLAKIEDLVAKAAADQMPAIALTDHGVMYGAIEFYEKCKKAGVKPIIGVEAYISSKGRLIKQAGNGERRFHVILLAKNEIGYKNLIKLTTIAHLEGFYYKPRIDWEVLSLYHDGIICLSACQQGEIGQAVLGKTTDDPRTIAKKYLDLFGEGNYYLEVQHHPNLPAQKILNDEIYKIGAELNIPIVATNDVHYLNTEDAEAHDILICLQTKKKITDTDRMSYLGEDFSLFTTAQMADFFRSHPEVIENTNKIVEDCNLEIKLGEIQLPYFAVPEGKTEFEYLRELCIVGLEKRFKINPAELKDESEKKIIERMEYELSVIEKTGYASYFLIVQDFILWSKNNGVVVGPGRGSAAGSLVAYLTQITNLNPLDYDLLFERFLNPDRISMPDIDTDFADTRRADVIRYVEGKYGKDHVSQIVTFGTMAARAALRDVGRVLDLPYSFCDRVAKLVPMKMDLGEALEKNLELKDLYASNQEAKRLLDFARKLEGVARHASTHACGIVITKKPLVEYLPTQYSSTDDVSIVSQYSLHPVEDLGLLKMDFLGLKNLTIIEQTLEVIEKIHGLKIDLDQLPLNDEKTYKLFQDGKTTGVFQFESGGMKKYLKMLAPTAFEDLIAMVALYRPGPLNSGMVEEFIDRKHGRKAISYAVPIMENSLKNTYGVIVYQEQVMQLSKDMAGFTGGQADTLRKAMGKKIAELMEKMKIQFVEGCLKNNISKKIAEDTFSSMEKFAEYGFNKSHAACYALVAYQTAYLKANYPAEFMASLLTSDEGDMDRVAIEIDECKQMQIEVLPPDVNESYRRFTVVAASLEAKKPRIRFGLNAIRNVGEGIVDTLMAERKQNGKYASLEDFLTRVQTKDLNRKSIEGLTKSGAFDRFGERNSFLENLDKILLFAKSIEEEANNRQTNLFGGAGETRHLQLLTYPEATKAERLSWEKEFLGLYVSEHPFTEIGEKLKAFITPLHEIKQGLVTSPFVLTAGVVSGIDKIVTSKGEAMLFMRIEDNLGGVETLVFPRLYQELISMLAVEKVVIVAGNLSEKDAEPKILANMIWELNDNNFKEALSAALRFQPNGWQKKKVRIKYSLETSPALAEELKNIFRRYPGENQVFLEVDKKLAKTTFRVKFCPLLAFEIKKILGDDAVRLE
jgi:DNA polymerase-3 subunit alpha